MDLDYWWELLIVFCLMVAFIPFYRIDWSGALVNSDSAEQQLLVGFCLSVASNLS